MPDLIIFGYRFVVSSRYIDDQRLTPGEAEILESARLERLRAGAASWLARELRAINGAELPDALRVEMEQAISKWADKFEFLPAEGAEGGAAKRPKTPFERECEALALAELGIEASGEALRAKARSSEIEKSARARLRAKARVAAETTL